MATLRANGLRFYPLAGHRPRSGAEWDIIPFMGPRSASEGDLPERGMPRRGTLGRAWTRFGNSINPKLENCLKTETYLTCPVHYPDTCTPFGPQARQGETAERKYGVLFRDAAFGSVPRERVTSKCFREEWLPINLQVVVQEPLVYLPVYGEASDGWVVMFLPFQQR